MKDSGSSGQVQTLREVVESSRIIKAKTIGLDSEVRLRVRSINTMDFGRSVK